MLRRGGLSLDPEGPDATSILSNMYLYLRWWKRELVSKEERSGGMLVVSVNTIRRLFKCFFERFIFELFKR